MKRIHPTILIALLALAPLPAAAADTPNPDDMTLGGISTDIGEDAMMIAAEMTAEAATFLGELDALWKKPTQAYSATVSAWYGVCDKIADKWDAGWAQVTEAARKKARAGKDFKMPDDWRAWERANRTFLTQDIRNRGLEAILFYRTARKQRDGMDADCTDNLIKCETMLADARNTANSLGKVSAAIDDFDNGNISLNELKSRESDLSSAEAMANVIDITATRLQGSVSEFFKDKLVQPDRMVKQRIKLLVNWAKETQELKLVEAGFTKVVPEWSLLSRDWCTTKYKEMYKTYGEKMAPLIAGKLFAKIDHFADVTVYAAVQSIVRTHRKLFNERVK